MAVFTEATLTGEVRVETGTGLVEKVEHDGNKRNAKVTFKATHAPLTQPVVAWADTWDGATWPLVQEAAAERFELDYRIEVHRKDGVDAARKIADLGNMEKVRDLAAIARRGELPENETRPRHQAAAGAQTPGDAQPPAKAPEAAQGATEPDGPGWLGAAQRDATAQREAHRAPPTEDKPPAHQSGPRCELCDVTVETSRALLDHGRTDEHLAKVEAAKNPAPAPAAETTAPAPEPRGRPQQGPRRSRVEEAKPSVLYNTDGSINLASWSYQAVVGMVELAYELTAARAAVDGTELRMEQVERLGRILLDAADKVQATIRADGHVDRMDSSHTRARGAVRTALSANPVPFGADADARAAWAETLVAHAAGIALVALDLFRFHETGEARP